MADKAKPSVEIDLRGKYGTGTYRPRLFVTIHKDGEWENPDADFVSSLLLGLQDGDGEVEEVDRWEPDEDDVRRHPQEQLMVQFEDSADAFSAGVYLDTILVERHFVVETDLSRYDSDYTSRYER